ncbi:MAG: STAS domain-containing protein [Desulfotomaculales bacterium]
MTEELTVVSRREGDAVIFDLAGDLTKKAEAAVLEAYQRATAQGVRRLLFNFHAVKYINSSGIAILIAVIAEARKRDQEVGGFGLSAHYTRIFEMTGLPQYMRLYEDEGRALAG